MNWKPQCSAFAELLPLTCCMTFWLLNSSTHKVEILKSVFLAFPEILEERTQIVSVVNSWKSKLWKFEKLSQQNTWESVSIWGPLTGTKLKGLEDEGKGPSAKISCKLSSSKVNNLCAEGYWRRVQCLIFFPKPITRVSFNVPKLFLFVILLFLPVIVVGFSVKAHLNSRK